MIKIVATSDAHGYTPEIKEDFDILLLAGDNISLRVQRNEEGTISWYENEFVGWINSLPFKDENSKVFWIAGNHEVAFSKLSKEVRLGLATIVRHSTNQRAIYLEDEMVESHGLKIYGTPWCTIFGNWGFMRSDEDLVKLYDKVPHDLDILLTHDAPYGTSDLCYGWNDWGRTPEHVGNTPLRDTIIRTNPRYNIHGHLHSANHEFERLNSTDVACVSLVNEAYNIYYEPLVLNL